MSSSSSTPSKKYPYGCCQMRNSTGDPCRMPALQGERFCHYHKLMGKPAMPAHDDFLPYNHIYLPRLEDAPSIQAAISEVCELMLHRRIEPKEASALFYAMQVASQNLIVSNLPPLNRGAAAPVTTTSNPLPPGTIQASTSQPARRRRGRPRKAAPQLVRVGNLR
jgi:hypothetical protein